MRKSVTARAKILAVRTLGTTLAEQSAAVMLTDRRLRVLAYHGIPDVGRFAHQMAHVTQDYVPVGQREVLAAFEGETRLPRRAVWVTFDDGNPEVVTRGQAVLDRLGIRATLFVCPGLVGTTNPFWWEIVDAALGLGVRPADVPPDVQDEDLTLRLKQLPDGQRRELVARLEDAVVARTEKPLRRDQLTEAQLGGWVEAGHGVGNHTWDHPCLDRCDPDNEREQVLSADRWLQERWPGAERLFAYPNGNWSPVTESVLVTNRYRLAVLFDHRLARVTDPPLRLSRLRIASDAPMPRFRSIVSGMHSGALGVGARFTQAGTPAGTR